MQRTVPVNVFAVVLTTVVSASVAALLDGYWDTAVIGPAAGLGLLYCLAVIPLVRCLAPKQMKAGPILAVAVGLAALFVPLLASVIGLELAMFLAPLVAWAVLSLGVIVLVQDVRPEVGQAVCHPCGYNLTRNVSGVCPECGTPTAEPDQLSLSDRWDRALPLQLRRWAIAIVPSILLGWAAPHVVPQFDGSICDPVPNIQAQLQTIRSQIELHNVQNPGDPFDPVKHGWSQLVDRQYLQNPPRNPLQCGSTKIGTTSAGGVGWFWASQVSWPYTTIYAVDESGGPYDPDSDGSWY